MVAYGSTGSVDYVSPGVVLKKPHIAIGKTTVDKLRTNCFAVERKILERLGHHPRIVRFLGAQGMSLLLGEANRGDLQDYLIAHPDIPVAQRLAWCRQITEAIEYIHGHGVIHSDLRPGNILVHESAPGSLDLQLCDFGGAACEELGVDGQSLPDGPFYSPVFKYEMNTLSDIFGLGSVMYTIITGRWPYRDTAERFKNIDERLAWEEDFVYPRFQREEFPDVDGLALGKVILGCWKREFSTVQDVLRAIDKVLLEGE